MRSKKYYLFLIHFLKKKKKDNEKIFMKLDYFLTFVLAVESGCTSKFHVISSTLMLCSGLLSILTLWHLSRTLVPGQSLSSRSLLVRCSLHSELISTGYIFKFKQFYIYWQVKEVKRWRGKQNCFPVTLRYWNAGSILASLALHLCKGCPGITSVFSFIRMDPSSSQSIVSLLSSSSHVSANFQLFLLSLSPLQFGHETETGGSFWLTNKVFGKGRNKRKNNEPHIGFIYFKII